MVHKSSILPGISQFLDSTVLSHYPPTAMKRIVAAGAIALFLKQNNNVVDTLLNHPLIGSLGVTTSDGMVNIDTIRDTFKPEISKAGFMRINFPMLGDVDFTVDDLDTLYNVITAIDRANSQTSVQAPTSSPNIGGLIGN